jgi:hypothetical protein
MSTTDPNTKNREWTQVGKSRDTGNIEHNTQNEEKQNNTTPKTKKLNTTDLNTKNMGWTKVGKSRDTGNIEHKTQNEDKQNNTTQKTKRWTQRTSTQKTGDEPRWENLETPVT